jgi:hypothetical protein
MSTASKAPDKSTEGVNTTKKTKDNALADGEKMKRVRKERRELERRRTSITFTKVSCLTLQC